jgi:hypothetical protein
VAYLIRGPKDTMMGLLAQFRMAEPLASMALKEVVLTEGEVGETAYLSVGLQALGVKWNAGYPDVDCHEKLWLFFEENADLGPDDSRGVDGKFTRVGEDTSDIEDRSFGDGDWELFRELDVSVSLDIDSTAFEQENDIRKEELDRETPA